MEPFVGLRNLKSSRKRAVDWVDFGHIVYLLSLTEKEGYKVCPLKGLGQFMYDTLQANKSSWDQYEKERFVAEELIKVYNGLLTPKAYRQDIYSEDAHFRRGGDVCIGQFQLKHSSHLPEDKRVAIGNERYPSICLGQVKCSKTKEVLNTIKIWGHRLACWLINGNPTSDRSDGSKQVVSHACVGRSWCVRPECLTWDTQQANIESARAHKKRRRSRWVHPAPCCMACTLYCVV